VNFNELGDAKVVAVRGDNGTGKTTLLETAYLGAVYRWLPSRGPLSILATDKDSDVEAKIDIGGESYTLHHEIDGISRQPRNHSYLRDSMDVPLCEGGAKQFDAAVARIFPPRELLLASSFASQKQAGQFLSLAPGQRKALLAELLGLKRLQSIAAVARNHRKRLDAEMAARGDLAGKADAIRQRIDAARVVAAKSTEDRRRKQAQLSRLQHELEEHEIKVAAWMQQSGAARGRVKDAQHAVLSAQKDECIAVEERQAASKRVDDVTASINRCDMRLSGADALQAVADTLSDAEELEADLEHRIQQLALAWSEHRTKLAQWQTERYQRKVDSEAAARELSAAEADFAVRLREAQRVLDECVAAKADRGRLPCGDELAQACVLSSRMASLASQADQAASDLRVVEAERDAALSHLRTAAVSASEHLRDMPSAPVCDSRDMARGLQIAKSDAASRVLRARKAQTELAVLEEVRVARQQESEQYAEAARVLKEAESKARDASMATTQARSTASLADAELAEVASMEPRWTPEQQAAMDRARSSVAQCDMDIARAEAEVSTLSGILEERQAEIAIQKEAEKHRGDWMHLEQAFGANGIQALEIDAAGPEISLLATGLLDACYGSRFTLTLQTTALRADGRAEKETCDLQVLDTERGTEISATQLSGGEQVLVGEALSLAIAIYHARRSAVPLLDLVRDECAGALSEANAARYVEMLHRAADVGGFHRIYYVAHQASLWGLADASLVLSDGDIGVQHGN
jgi:exonuclease SbcC